MANKHLFSILALLLTLLSMVACSGLKTSTTFPARHPTAEELTVEPKNCVECHEGGTEIPYQRYVHDADWGRNHRQAAYQGEAICAMCHQTSFCNDCHATDAGLKPSEKNDTEPYRSMPHRGDYLSRHRIDGRIDPTSCIRCHGNPKAAATCVRCHG
jgi:predicted small lipoprotein YifL